MTAADVVALTRDGRLEDFVREAVSARRAGAHGSRGDVGAELGEVEPQVRLTNRNGCRPRTWATRARELELLIPRKSLGASVLPKLSRAARRKRASSDRGGRDGGLREQRRDPVSRPPGGEARDRRDDAGPHVGDLPIVGQDIEIFPSRPLEGAPPRICGSMAARQGPRPRPGSKAPVVAYAVDE
jgi:hypothetical protein